jgi:hypothetical protein
MCKPEYAFVRQYALELLTDVHDQPHIDKEQLFSDAMAFFSWQFTDKEAAEESLDLYMHEFKMHHHQVVNKLTLEVWGACFITWFVEQGFHKLPPLANVDTTDPLILTTRFSSPSFRLPTGMLKETYLIQWILWHLENLPAPLERANGTLVYQWSQGLLESLPVEAYVISRRVINDAMRFFFWAREHLRTWVRFSEYEMAFLYSRPECKDTLLNDPCSDTLFIGWFVENVLDHAE